MSRYALLVEPSANRVYADASVGLTAAELEIFSERVLGGRLHDAARETIGGVSYLTFEGELRPEDLAFLSNVSTAFALFELAENGPVPLLRPCPLTPLDRYDDDLLTVLKYSGKTNETFTRLLLNVTVLAGASAADALTRRLRILDPLCGRGTTLNQALMYGYDATGVDLDRKDFDAYAAFLKSWLTRKRLKHRIEVHPVRRDKKVIARRLDASLAASKEQHRAGESQQLTVLNADTLRAAELLPKASFDALVTDAPYGVQHGSRGAGGELARRPLDLLGAALPGWVALLRPGAALGIAWNTRVAGRERVAGLLDDAGLEVQDSAAYLRLGHRVDQAIWRDVIVARHPG